MIHAFDVTEPSPIGGIETWIANFLDHAHGNFRLLGMAPKSPSRVLRQFGVAEVVVAARFSKPRKVRVPNTVKIGIGIVRNRRSISRDVVVHRVELVPLVRLVCPSSRIVLFMHTNSLAQTRRGSDSLWRLFPAAYFLVETLGIKSANQVFVYSPVDLPRVQEISSRASVQPAWYDHNTFGRIRNGARDMSLVVWAGRFETVKDPFLAIRTFEQIASSSDVRLLMVGSGSLRDPAVELVKMLGLQGQIRIEPAVSPARLSELLAGAGSLLITSHFEGSPRIIVEALACGTRVVASSESDPEEWTTDPRYGCRAERNAPALAAAVLKVLRSAPQFVDDKVGERSASRVVPKLEGELDRVFSRRDNGGNPR